MKRAENKVIIVTGGTLGIGRETCLLLTKDGVKVALIKHRRQDHGSKRLLQGNAG